MATSSINDIEIDHFDSGIDFLATMGFGPCISCLIVLDKRKNIFIEHRTTIYLPSEINLETVRSCLEKVAKHCSDTTPQLTITAVFILDGINVKRQFTECKNIINEMLQNDAAMDESKQLSSIKELLKNIKFYNTMFNMGTAKPEDTGEPNIDLIIARCSQNNPKICFVQNVTEFATSNVIVSVLSIELETMKSQYMMNMSEIQNNHSKSKHLFNI
ncbi:unnamed protein product [Adineta steineri]|uniref:Uncharacterized protein n=2 Tax=Adineta steineri TaxID=433720 RepID=A0A814AXC7_9BILA|nr:unnamed protein product [Adineta steineri]CAF3603512.1 unnamed protein product [Adineta steineri]